MKDSGVYIVIGSGPAGISCAQALLGNGSKVLLVDVGEKCPEPIQQTLLTLAQETPEKWSPKTLQTIKGPAYQGSEPPLKLAYGSAFPYATHQSELSSQLTTRCVQSFARGGLSNVWGAAVLPARTADLGDWPITLQELEPHYRAVAEKILKIAATRDELQELFPLYGAEAPAATLSKQAQYLLQKLRSKQRSLAEQGIFFGQSRLAIRTQQDTSAMACQNVGLCLSGCPYSAIYNSSQTLDQLLQHPHFQYLPQHKVMTIQETSDGVTVHALREKENIELHGTRVFVAAGVISTLSIVLRSLQAPEATTIPIHYHPYFLLPLVLFRNFADVETERLHTLAQLFLEIQDPAISEHLVHLQVYTYNELFRQRLHGLFGRIPALDAFAKQILLGRLLAVQGYLNSKDTNAIVAEWRDGKIQLQGQNNAATDIKMKKIYKKLQGLALTIGALPLPQLSYRGLPGDGNHIGGTFPMRKVPRNAFETDRLGRLQGLQRLHIVDASVLPSLPASTITYTAMANAHRIATELSTNDR